MFLSAPICPKCAAEGDHLRFVGRELPAERPLSALVVEGYQCQACGMGFTFCRPLAPARAESDRSPAAA